MPLSLGPCITPPISISVNASCRRPWSAVGLLLWATNCASSHYEQLAVKPTSSPVGSRAPPLGYQLLCRSRQDQHLAVKLTDCGSQFGIGATHGERNVYVDFPEQALRPPAERSRRPSDRQARQRQSSVDNQTCQTSQGELRF